MMVLITYDVDTISEDGQKRLRKVAKVCLNYGQRVQNSVFECLLTEAQFVKIRHELESLIDMQLDSVRFYFLGNNWKRRVETLGKKTSIDYSGELII